MYFFIGQGKKINDFNCWTVHERRKSLIREIMNVGLVNTVYSMQALNAATPLKNEDNSCMEIVSEKNENEEKGRFINIFVRKI